MTAPMKTVAIPLGDRSYDVIIGRGALAGAAGRLAALCPRGRAVIVADRAVLARHRETLQATLDAAGLTPVIIEVTGGESAKSWIGVQHLCDALLEFGLERGENLIALGGGTVGDLAGFAAAITKRGTGFIQIPTTLLAQVDSSVGGKTGINTAHGKNLVGAFHQPGLVIADTLFLRSLPSRELAAGYAEIVKAALIGDAALFARLETAADRALDLTYLDGFIADAVAFKAAIVAEDEREAGRRALLNLGHTFAHAFEADARPGALIHGEAVACGIVMAFRYSERIGSCPPGTADRVAAHLSATGLPTTIAGLAGGPYDAAELVARMRSDKKNSNGSITLVLAHGIGDAYIAPGMDGEDLTAFLQGEIDGRAL